MSKDGSNLIIPSFQQDFGPSGSSKRNKRLLKAGITASKFEKPCNKTAKGCDWYMEEGPDYISDLCCKDCGRWRDWGRKALSENGK